MREKIGVILGVSIIAIMFIVSFNEGRPQKSNFGQILSELGEQQERTSELFTTEVISDFEGQLVGEHKVDGSNWAIPNIVRYWLGVD